MKCYSQERIVHEPSKISTIDIDEVIALNKVFADVEISDPVDTVKYEKRQGKKYARVPVDNTRSYAARWRVLAGHVVRIVAHSTRGAGLIEETRGTRGRWAGAHSPSTRSPTVPRHAATSRCVGKITRSVWRSSQRA